MQVQSLGQEDPLREGMATHSNILAWEIPWTEEPGGLMYLPTLQYFKVRGILAIKRISINFPLCSYK